MTTTSDFLRHLRSVAARQTYAALSDQQLLERFLHERSETSFAALVQRHGPMVLSVCRRVLHHAQDVEDAFQATFLILARKAGSIRQRQSLSSWLHGVAHRSAGCLRAKARRRAAHERSIDPPPPGDAMDEITWLPGIDLEKVNQAFSCKTDKNGRFRLQGFGRDRVVYVHMRGEKTANRDVDIVTRRDVPHELSQQRRDVFPARADYMMVPSKPILGTIRDKRTGKPLAGVSVIFVMSRPYFQATTDEQGRYRLTGVCKRQEYAFAAGGAPFTSVWKRDIADTPGLDPITVDFEIERAIAVRGRLLDKATGKPVKGTVSYVTLFDNPHLKKFTTFNTGFIMDHGRTGSDGSFVVTGIPGPGLLCAQADDGERVCGAEINKSWKTNAVLEGYHAAVAIDLDEKDAKSAVRDIFLEAGRTLKGSVVDADGRPLKGAFAAGRRPLKRFVRENAEQKLASDSFTVGGLKPGRPRPLLFFHPETKLGKLLRLGGDEKEPLVVRLEPLGALSGRVVDGQGHPLANRKVIVQFDSRDPSAVDAEKLLPREITFMDPLWTAAMRDTTTNRDGKFRIEGLIPGVKYELLAGGEELQPGRLHLARYRADGLTVESGKTKDLDDLKRQ